MRLDTLSSLMLLAAGFAAQPLLAQASPWSPAFGESTGWKPELHPRTMADVDGDGLGDMVGFGYSGVHLARSTGSEFEPERLVLAGTYGLGSGWVSDRHIRTFADVNGDGRDDVVGFGERYVWVARSKGDHFEAPEQWSPEFVAASGWTVANNPRLLADVNGDGSTDVVAFGTHGVMVATSTGVAFRVGVLAHAEFGAAQGWSPSDVRTTGDVNGDGFADVVGFGPVGTIVCLGGPTGLGAPSLWSGEFGANTGWSDPDFHRVVADVDDDDNDDIIGFGPGGTWVAFSDGAGSFGSLTMLPYFAQHDGWGAETPRFAADMDGNGTADLVGFDDDGVQIAYSYGGEIESLEHVSCGFHTSDCRGGEAELRFLRDVDGDTVVDIVGVVFDGVHVDTTRGGCRQTLTSSHCGAPFINLGLAYSTPEVTITLDAGPEASGGHYLLLGSASGVDPGTTFLGTHVPLIRDWFFDHTWMYANTLHNNISLNNTFGVLDSGGRATAQYSEATTISSYGFTRYWSFVYLDPSTGSWRASDWIRTSFTRPPIVFP